jgi:hypothetical protein
VTGAAEGDALTELLGLNKSPSLNLGEAGLAARLGVASVFALLREVSLWAILLATRRLQAGQVSQPVMLSLQLFCAGDVFLQVKAIRRAIRTARLLLELAQRKCWPDRLLKRA